MQRTMLYLLALCVFLGIDTVANNGAVTRDVVKAVVGVGKSVTHAAESTVAFMVGQ